MFLKPTPLFFRADEGKKAETKTRTKPSAKPEEEKLFCKNCGHWITSGPWRISVHSSHQHIFFNPAGVIYKIGCFREAPGTQIIGVPSNEFTWFHGHVWQVALCQECRTHLGWLFTGEKISNAFFGLILPKLTPKAP